MSPATLEFRIVDRTLEHSLAAFFRDIDAAGDEQHFHPHPLTDEEAYRLAHYSGKDLYYVLIDGSTILGYGMLRGWDDGFQEPSLGIVIHPSSRGMGLGRLFMHFLHAAARWRGAREVRLKVYPENKHAVALYEALGYAFRGREQGQLVGFFSL